MVLKNVRVGLTCEVSGGVSGLGFLVMSCLFGLGLQDKSCSVGVRFSIEGVSGHCHKHPMYKLPIVGSIFFRRKIKKQLLVQLTNF
jgi:hypothetical protein